MLEPENNPNASIMVDPPAMLRRLMAWQFARKHGTAARAKQRVRAEAKRKRDGAPHVVEYFHQLDDPYSHLTAQVLAAFVERYDIELRTWLVRAAGGKNQPELEKLAVWARRDAALVAPHYELSFPEAAATTPDPDLVLGAARVLADLPPSDFVSAIDEISSALWEGSLEAGENAAGVSAALDQGSARRAELGHYSGATFFYAGEWYWGVDRLFHLEARLRELGACREPDTPFLAPRPDIDVSDVDASALQLDFYPSLNSPYTSIIYDRTIAMKDACGIRFNHKPVLPMIMRGVPATPTKGNYIIFDTQREADYFGVPFGPMITPIGTPTRRAYALLPWASDQGKDEALMSSLLKHAFALGVGLHTTAGMRKAVEAAGLDWQQAQRYFADDTWKMIVERHQDEMVEGLGLWGVPSYALRGGGEDLAVWGQDRLWLIAAEIRRRCAPESQSSSSQ